MRCYFGIIAVFFLASTAYLQAQGPYTGGSLTINSDADVPSDVATITTIDGTLKIGGTITSFPNFAALKVVETHLQILRLSSTTLTTLTDIFPALREVKMNLSINLNPELTTVSGFDMLTTIAGKLTIFSNAKLTTISGFGAITSIGTFSDASIDISKNGMLSSCCGLIRFVDGTAPPTGSTTYDNAPGCNSPAEIIADCRTLAATPSSLTPTAAEGMATFDVTADTPWEITNSDTWITSIMPKTGSDNQTITISYEENTSIDTRKAILTLAATETGATEMVEITLTQAGAARKLLTDKTDISVNADVTSATFNVIANVPWRINKRVADTFVTTISPQTGNNNQTITITYEENTAITNRKAILTLEATDAGTEMVTITLTQAEAARELSANKTRITVNADQTSATFNVTANVPWKITNSDTWITSFLPETGSDNQKITITYEENTAITSREATLTLAATGTGATEMVPITLTQAAAARKLSADKPNITVLDVAGSVTFNVIANVPWAITNSDTWITSFLPVSGTGSDNQTITITYEENTTGASREAILTLEATGGGSESETITLTQSEAGARVLSAAPSSLSPSAAAGNITFEVVSANVDWAITNSDTWITISHVTGDASQRITITYEENTAITSREATLTLATTETGETETLDITLTQAAAARQISADKTRIPVNADDTSVTFNVTANVPWEITQASPASWISSISPDEGTGSANQEITISYEENTATTNRVAILTLAATGAVATESETITLTQAAAARTLSTDKASIPVDADDTSATFNVTANVPWDITQASPVSWISSISHLSGNANQEITITYEENTTITSRDAVLTLAATETGATETVTITLTQAAAARKLSTDKNDISLTVDAGNAIFNVTANVPWEITKRAEDDWISSISTSSGRDNQEITIEYKENTAGINRKAILTLAATGGGSESETITLTQAAAARQFATDKTDISVNADDTSVTFNVTANVPWEITKRAEDTFITAISPDSGTDNQEITITYEENTATTTRDAVLTLAATGTGTESETITITQAAAVARVLSASPSNLTPTAEAGDVTFDVNANVPWRITKRTEDDWITTISPSSGRDPKRITIEYDENTTSTSRNAILTLAAIGTGGETVEITITQASANTLGIPTLANDTRFYPNPASQNIYIEGITQETSLIIRTLAGKTLLRDTLSQNQAVNIASLPQGVYLLTLQNAQAQITRRLVIGL